jgi:hypothetical protein
MLNEGIGNITAELKRQHMWDGAYQQIFGIQPISAEMQPISAEMQIMQPISADVNIGPLPQIHCLYCSVTTVVSAGTVTHRNLRAHHQRTISH